MLFQIVLHFFLASAALAQIQIEQPSSLSQCDSSTLTWSDGTAPYYVYIYPEFYLDESSFYEQLGPFDGTSAAYTVNVPAGKKIRINVRDSANPGFDGSAFTDVVTVGPGDDNSCLATGPIGTGGPPSLPTDTGLPSGLGTFSAPSLEPFPGTGSAPIDLTRTALTPVAMTSSASSPSSAITSVSMTGPTSGDGPMNGDSSNSGFLGHDTCLLALFIGALGAMGIIM